MKVIQTRVEIGEDRVLRLTLPEDLPAGAVELLIVLESTPRPVDMQARRAAVQAGAGILAGRGLSTEEFLAERREDDRRREAALGL